jgi:hypothetical protein
MFSFCSIEKSFDEKDLLAAFRTGANATKRTYLSAEDDKKAAERQKALEKEIGAAQDKELKEGLARDAKVGTIKQLPGAAKPGAPVSSLAVADTALFRQPVSPYDMCRAVLTRIFLDLRTYRQNTLTILQDNSKLRRELRLLDKNPSYEAHARCYLFLVACP